MEDVIRVGKVSSVNGNLLRVTYPDRSDTVTDELPIFSNGVYRIPNIGETVVVIHFSNGTTAGICLGGLVLNGYDYNLVDLLARLVAIEGRLTAAESRIEAIEALDENFEARISALEAKI